jgi:hypothetical protein
VHDPVETHTVGGVESFSHICWGMGLVEFSSPVEPKSFACAFMPPSSLRPDGSVSTYRRVSHLMPATWRSLTARINANLPLGNAPARSFFVAVRPEHVPADC